jgi:hypothetical protein
MAELTPRPAPEMALQRLGKLARRAGAGEISDREHARGRERLQSALERAALPLAPRPWWLIPAAAVPLLVILGAVLFRPAAPLSFTIDGAPPSESYVRAGPGGAIARFSEGTEIGFERGARGRITAVTARGARVNIEEGGAHFRVVHLPGAEWSAEAGPFVVAVTGTEFNLTWRAERLDLVMRDGSVIVRGPLASGGIALHGGQHLMVDLARGELTLAEPKSAAGPQAAESPGAPATTPTQASPSTAAHRAPGSPSLSSSLLDSSLGSAAPAPTASALPSAAAASAAAPSSEPGRPAAAPSLRERVARGDFAGVIADAEGRGIDAAIDASSLDDLAALADAARYAGRTDLARRALLAERSRFKSSAEARSAAFLLGRMSEAGSPAAAISWYDQYLSESPHGPLAPEALGRKMVAVKSSAGRDAARPVAEAYLARHPQGAFAAAAVEILAAQ